MTADREALLRALPAAAALVDRWVAAHCQPAGITLTQGAMANLTDMIATAFAARELEWAEVARSQEFYPGSLTGRRQAWLREAIARRVEGREPPEAPPLDDGPLVEAARREEREGCIETIWSLPTLWTAQRNVIKRCVAAIRARGRP